MKTNIDIIIDNDKYIILFINKNLLIPNIIYYVVSVPGSNEFYQNNIELEDTDFQLANEIRRNTSSLSKKECLTIAVATIKKMIVLTAKKSVYKYCNSHNIRCYYIDINRLVEHIIEEFILWLNMNNILSQKKPGSNMRPDFKFKEAS